MLSLKHLAAKKFLGFHSNKTHRELISIIYQQVSNADIIDYLLYLLIDKGYRQRENTVRIRLLKTNDYEIGYHLYICGELKYFTFNGHIAKSRRYKPENILQDRCEIVDEMKKDGRLDAMKPDEFDIYHIKLESSGKFMYDKKRDSPIYFYTYDLFSSNGKWQKGIFHVGVSSRKIPLYIEEHLVSEKTLEYLEKRQLITPVLICPREFLSLNDEG